MEKTKLSGKYIVIANQNPKARNYWLNQLSGELEKTGFPYDNKIAAGQYHMVPLGFKLPDQTASQLLKLSRGSDHALHILLTAALTVLLGKYTSRSDIILASPIYKQQLEGEFINTVLTLRVPVKNTMTFKQLILQTKETVTLAVENQEFPIDVLLDQLNIPITHDNESPLFDTAILVENIQYKKYLRHLNLNMIFSFIRKNESIEGVLEYNRLIYRDSTVGRIVKNFIRLLKEALINIDVTVGHMEILSESERKRLLYDFNDTKKEYPGGFTIHGLFQAQVYRTPGNTAAICDDQHLTYRELNQRANQLARLLGKNGITPGTVVGMMVKKTVDMMVYLLAILKAGGAYLPIDTNFPAERVLHLLTDSGVKMVLTDSQDTNKIPICTLQGLESRQPGRIVVTPPREHIKEYDQLPMPDRSHINLRNYKNKIGMASVTNGISVQTTRGCPYKCLYCHKIWSKHHVSRSAENIYNEIQFYYKRGVRNFAVIDDCFNLDRKESSGLFRLIIKNKLNPRIFFPNGLRGDILTPGYIDLMVEAGTRGINLSLETASPRLQKLLNKNLDLDKFKGVMDYIAGQHPGIILEIATMHGFPSETEEEAMMTLNFIKSIKWLHFPYIHILKIFPNTEMEAFALEQGISKKDISISKDRAFHELPETLPFPKSFSRKYQSAFLNEYFLDKERLKKVLPVQMKILSEDALAQKYNAYLPVEIKNSDDIIEFAQLEDFQLPGKLSQENDPLTSIFDREPILHEAPAGAGKILFLDLSQHFSTRQMLYKVVEQPLGMIYLLTYLKHRFADKIDGRIYKSGNDFDSFKELKALVDSYKPNLIAIRTLTFFKDFFHETVSLLRQWEIKAPIITGGPYAASDYHTILKDENIDLVVLGEGEYTLAELIEIMLAGDFKLPAPHILRKIKGIAFAQDPGTRGKTRKVIVPERITEIVAGETVENPKTVTTDTSLAYVMYTSGSTGKSKGVMVEHSQVNNCISWMQDKFNLNHRDVILNRTNLTFDPSVWEIFWPLHTGAAVKVLDEHRSKDAGYLTRLMSDDLGLTMMYCPATLVKIMVYLLGLRSPRPQLKLPWLIIGAEPISMEVVKSFYRYFKGKIVNTYGPTEGTINNTYYDLTPDDRRPVVPIGKPVTNNRLYILSDDMRLQPIGVTGEIYIAGKSVARGYINNSLKTRENFIPGPFREGILYKTGDMGRWSDDGLIEIMGRIDHQVKIRGYRIEPVEIETALLTYPGVNDCVVIVKGDNREKQKTLVCKKCGITSKYPDAKIDRQGFCEICREFSRYKAPLDAYFKTLDQLEQTIREKSKQEKGTYDCLLLYSGGRGAAYALYRLVERGLRVMSLTYDNGYFSKADLRNIKQITASLEVPHVILTHKNSQHILRESMKSAHTICRGCINTSASLGGEYAYNHRIPVVVGAILSQGQIIENKLFMFLKQGITRVSELEKNISQLQQSAVEIDKKIFEYIDIDVVTNGTVHDKVTFLDFYRYCDVTNEEIINYLDNKAPYWKSRKTYAVYSTNCPIKQLGDFGHLEKKGYHYYGSATSWEKRLGHLTLENLKEDLTCTATAKGYENFLKRIAYTDRSNKHNPFEKNEKYLCAYFVRDQSGSSGEFTIPGLRDYLSGKLPDYMIPSYFKELEEIPLDTNGKVERHALPEPEFSALSGKITPPESNIQKILIQLWSEVLNLEKTKIGIDNNFFELGGHSLRATLLVSRIYKEFKVNVSYADAFTRQTIKEMAAYIGEAGVDNGYSIKSAEKKEYYPLTSAQKRIYIMQQMQPQSILYNMTHFMILEGEVDMGKLERNFCRLIRAHEILRASFQLVGNEPVMRIHKYDDMEFEILYKDISTLPLPDSSRDIIDHFICPLELSRSPLLRVGVIKQDHKKYLLMIDTHHIINDGTSLTILVKDFAARYMNRAPPLMRIQYKDFASWQNSEPGRKTIKKQEEYWINQFKGEIPRLDLPTDYPRPRDHDIKGTEIYFEIGPEESGKLKEMAMEMGGTLFMVLLAVYNILLAKLSRQKEIVVGVAAADRSHPDLQHLIGMFVNILAVKTSIPGETPFVQFLNEIKTKMLAVYENQDYPFEELVKKLALPRQSTRNPLFDVCFVYQDMAREAVHLPGITLAPYPGQHKISRFDITLVATEVEEKLIFAVEYRNVLFKDETIDMFTRYFKKIVSTVIENPKEKIKNIDIIDNEEKEKVSLEIQRTRETLQAEFDI